MVPRAPDADMLAGHLFWNYLVHVLFICHEANAARHGFNYWRVSYQRTCASARGIGKNTRAESPEVIVGR
jgi:hypothetical protein